MERIKNALLTVTDRVYHGFGHQAEVPYIIWMEDGAGPGQWADNRMICQTITGTVDLFTDDPDDRTLFLAVQAALNGVCSWRLNDILYESDTGLTHYEWCWVIRQKIGG